MAFDWSHLDTSADSLIRSGAGVVGIVLGVFILLARPRRARNVAFGLWAILDGLGYAAYALGGGFLDFPHKELVVPTLVTTSLLSFAAAASLLVFAWPNVRRLLDAPAALCVAAAAFVPNAGLTPFLLLIGERLPLETYGSPAGLAVAHVDSAMFGLFVGVVAVAAVATLEAVRRAPEDARGRARLMLAGALLLSCVMSVVPLNLTTVPMYDLQRAGDAALLVAAIAMLPAALWPLGIRHVGSWPSAVPVAMALLVLATATVQTVLLAGDMRDGGFGGIASLVGLGALAFAIFGLELLGARVPRPRAGLVAAVGLAILFITAQVAQNFFSAKYGLLLGGIVAGAAVFAAYPLQRAAERALDRGQSRAAATGPADKYRRLVEVAWQDGKLGANERLLLAESRRQLGLDAEAAAGIDEEVARLHATRPRGA